MGRTATYVHVIVQPGCRIEVAAPPGLREGDQLDVVLLTRERAGEAAPRSLLDILDSLPRSAGIFKSQEEIDAYIRDERNSWER